MRIGGINSNTFQDEDYKLGSLCHPSADVRKKAVAHILDCCEIARQTDSSVVKVWLGDGTNYPGQDDFRARRRRLIECLREIYPALPRTPACSWSTSSTSPPSTTPTSRTGARRSPSASTLATAPSCASIRAITRWVSTSNRSSRTCSRRGRLGGFDLNDKKYGDDDLMVGSIDPYQLFRICHELVKALADADDPVARGCAEQTVYMLDQCHNIEPKIPAVIRSVMNLQEAFAKALLVDLPALRAAQAAGDVLEANSILKDAYDTDVRPLLGRARADAGLPQDPYRAYLGSDEQRQRASSRVGGVAAGWQ